MSFAIAANYMHVVQKSSNKAKQVLLMLMEGKDTHMAEGLSNKRPMDSWDGHLHHMAPLGQSVGLLIAGNSPAACAPYAMHFGLLHHIGAGNRSQLCVPCAGL